VTKQKLKFKVDGGLKKLSEFYATAEKEAGASDMYWKNPAALLEALEVAPSKEIRISSGYKKLADTMDTIDFEKWHGTFDMSRDDGDLGVQEKAFTSLWHAVAGADRDALEAGRLNDKFEQALTVTVTVTITITITMTMTMTSTVTSGRKEEPRAPVPGAPSLAPRDLAMMSRYAQTIADHMSLYAE
jgi:hypothetical protein